MIFCITIIVWTFNKAQYLHSSHICRQRSSWIQKKQSICPCWTIYWSIGYQGPNPNPLNPIRAEDEKGGKTAEINQRGLQSEQKGNKHTSEQRMSLSQSDSPSVCPSGGECPWIRYSFWEQIPGYLQLHDIHGQCLVCGEKKNKQTN